jgi:hypothetical protein
VTQIIFHEQSAGIPEIVLARTPLIFTPGKDSFKLPSIVPVNGISVTAGMLEVVLVKDASIKDLDPESFSSFKILQGLKHNIIRCMIQDKKGESLVRYVWRAACLWPLSSLYLPPCEFHSPSSLSCRVVF